MGSVSGERRQVNGRRLLMQALDTAHTAMLDALGRHLSALLLEAVTYLLGRAAYARRREVPRLAEQSGACQRCRGHAGGRLLRNGYRRRSLLTPLGWVEFWLPRVRCACGGSVTVELGGLVRPYQRISDLVDEQVCRWYRLGLSLRQLQAELGHSYLGPVALRTLLARVHQLVPPSPLVGIPPSSKSTPFGSRKCCPTAAPSPTARGAAAHARVAANARSSSPWAFGRRPTRRKCWTGWWPRAKRAPPG